MFNYTTSQIILKKNILYSYLLGLIILTSTSCEPEVIVPDQGKIFTSYSMIYNESLNKTTAKASFNQNTGSSQLQELTNPANVLYKDDLLLFNSSENHYRKEFIGLQEGNFSYTDLDENNYINSTNMVSMVEFVDIPDSISVNDNLNLLIDGPPLLSNEELVFSFESLSSDVILFFTSETLSTATLVIDNQDLQGLGVGKVKMVIGRKSITNPISSSPEAGGELVIQYEIEDTIVFY